jgi:hypothetical protein
MKYADFIWDGCTNESSDILESVQYEAASLVIGAIKGNNRLSMLQELSWDLLKTRCQIHKVSIFYKMTSNLLPNYLSSLVPCSVSDRTTYSLRNKEDISIMYYSSAIRAWNLLPVDVRNSSSIANFKLKVGRMWVQDMPLFCIQGYD